MNMLYPLRLTAVSKEILWGGDRLKRCFGKSAPFARIAESWELTVRSAEMNLIGNGPCTGMTLADYISENGNETVSPHYDGTRFPLLIKFIDAADRLSIQVHPDDSYAIPNEGELGKTEMWYIVEADPGAQLVYGLKDGLSAADFAEAVHSGCIGDTLRYTEVHKGETYFIPAGQVHAIGAGILIAEIQQSSNVTYRVYDYDRRQADGTLRQLHTDKALDVVKIRSDEEIDAIRYANAAPEETLLAACPFFRVRRFDAGHLPRTVTPADSFIHLLCVEGAGEIVCGSETYALAAGDSYFIPRGCAPCTVTGDAVILLSETEE